MGVTRASVVWAMLSAACFVVDVSYAGRSTILTTGESSEDVQDSAVEVCLGEVLSLSAIMHVS